MSRWCVVLEYVRELLRLGLCHSLLVLGLIRDKGRLLRGQVSLVYKSSKPLYSKPLYIRRGYISI